jgi:Cu(I)/Ag(I) efflux system membrane fusion protein
VGADSLLVPREAVIRGPDDNRVVLAQGAGRFRSVAVELGRVDGRYAEILDGLEAGDEVVVSAQFLLDSESSKTSDFRRMEAMPAASEHDMDHADHTDHMDHADHADLTDHTDHMDQADQMNHGEMAHD